MSKHEKGQKAGAAHIGRIDHRAVEAVGLDKDSVEFLFVSAKLLEASTDLGLASLVFIDEQCWRISIPSNPRQLKPDRA